MKSGLWIWQNHLLLNNDCWLFRGFLKTMSSQLIHWAFKGGQLAIGSQEVLGLDFGLLNIRRKGIAVVILTEL
ncbi:hypothetical protein Hanom_Chr13g01233531 [Helianthus anomalus]